MIDKLIEALEEARASNQKLRAVYKEVIDKAYVDEQPDTYAHYYKLDWDLLHTVCDINVELETLKLKLKEQGS